jgi:hypothetical protein
MRSGRVSVSIAKFSHPPLRYEARRYEEQHLGTRGPIPEDMAGREARCVCSLWLRSLRLKKWVEGALSLHAHGLPLWKGCHLMLMC